MAPNLTTKQRFFVEAYLETLNATEAARRAGYKGNDNTLGVVGHENLNKPKIRELIDQRLREAAMGADEVLYRLTQQARASIGPFLRVEEEAWHINLQAVKEQGHLVKSISPTRSGIRLELYSAQEALNQLARYHSLFTDKVEHSGEITVKNISDEQHNRALSTLADALGEIVSGAGPEPEGAVGPAE